MKYSKGQWIIDDTHPNRACIKLRAEHPASRTRLFDTAMVVMYGSDDPDCDAAMIETHEANAAIISVAALAFDLARKVSNLNPNAGEIGDGMLRTIQSAAFEVVETAIANHVLITARTRRINAHKDTQ